VVIRQNGKQFGRAPEVAAAQLQRL